MQRVISSVIMLIVVVILAACGSRELLSQASFAPDTISPNADGVQDATSIHYELGRQANVSIYVQNASEQRYYFRNDQPRTSGVYDVLFGGVIDGQLLPDGDYTWVIEATDEAGQSQTAQGKLAVKDGDKTPPQITKFTVFPKEFTPNRDSLSDRVTINVGLNKPASLLVTLQNELCHGSDTPPVDNPTLVCAPFPLQEKEGAARKSGEAGLHEYDYDAGVDLGAEPPPDGTYVVTARVEDATGQTMAVSDTLTITDGGTPRAEIVDGTVNFSRSSLLVGDTLYFTLTIENYGAVPIRTSGPEPGYVYNLDQNYNVPGFAEESGAWRVGIDFDTSQRNYPFRWAVGNPEDLITQTVGGKTYYYLPPDTKTIVTGGIKITSKPPRDPLYFWAGLIHEDVEISSINNRVDPHSITIDQP
ncbi:MAG: hypothetical protein HGB05_00515 [Chloroflexi bacterium]|nr:hypothetical protein [Chloroflexota bacterium]